MSEITKMDVKKAVEATYEKCCQYRVPAVEEVWSEVEEALPAIDRTAVVSKQFSFEAAHFLPNVPEGHKCGRLHGHRYEVEIFCRGLIGEATGWVIDYADIASAVDPVIEELDHHNINEIPGLDNSTAENLAVWIWKRLEDKLPLSEIVIFETASTSVRYAGYGDK